MVLGLVGAADEAVVVKDVDEVEFVAVVGVCEEVKNVVVEIVVVVEVDVLVAVVEGLGEVDVVRGGTVDGRWTVVVVGSTLVLEVEVEVLVVVVGDVDWDVDVMTRTVDVVFCVVVVEVVVEVVVDVGLVIAETCDVSCNAWLQLSITTLFITLEVRNGA